METVSFSVQGMTCGGCAASVKRALEAIPGVSNILVTLTTGSVTAEIDPTRVKAEALRDAVTSAGYDVA